MRDGSNYAALFLRPELKQLAADSGGKAPSRVATVYAPQDLAPPSTPLEHGQLPAYAWAYGLETVDGYVVMYPDRYLRFWERVAGRLMPPDRRPVYLFMPDQYGPSPSVTNLADVCNQNLLSLANVRYVISPIRLTGEGVSLHSTDSDGPWPLYIYENTHALPRYFVVHSMRTYPSQLSLLNAMDQASLEELSSVAFRQGQGADGLPATGSPSAREAWTFSHTRRIAPLSP